MAYVIKSHKRNQEFKGRGYGYVLTFEAETVIHC